MDERLLVEDEGSGSMDGGGWSPGDPARCSVGGEGGCLGWGGVGE